MLYVFNTWTLANLLYMAVVLLLYGNPQGEFFRESSLSLYITGTFFSFVLSLPSLVAAWLSFRLVKKLQIRRSQRFFIWILLSLLLACIPWMINACISGKMELHPEEYQLLLAALTAAPLAVLLRCRSFFCETEVTTVETNASSHHQQTE